MSLAVLTRPSLESRPWGGFEVLANGVGYQLKRLVVQPGAALSLQRHRLRSEHWVVIEGCAEVTLDGRTELLGPNGAVFIPAGAVHRLANPGDAPLTVIELQTGQAFSETDIERLEDRYGRA